VYSRPLVEFIEDDTYFKVINNSRYLKFAGHPPVRDHINFRSYHHVYTAGGQGAPDYCSKLGLVGSDDKAGPGRQESRQRFDAPGPERFEREELNLLAILAEIRRGSPVVFAFFVAAYQVNIPAFTVKSFQDIKNALFNPVTGRVG
jgi:hypothetical protein